ncbi:nitroreductase family protein [Sporomusa aerivorans]|uniref:nitroreductase family protein n=1 Tax=Sporomusa aerivorans TaxID=204936 RepID=UPI00352A0763
MLKSIEMRRSIRKYKDEAVSDEDILRLIESARLAPSGSNTQPWHFIVVKDKFIKQRISEVSHNQKWMVTAPVFIVCIADIRSRIKEEIKFILDENSSEEEVKQIIRDTSIATEHILLTANSLGLGSCWVAWFTQNAIRPVLNIPSDKYVVGIITLGYADEQPKPRLRKRMEEILHYEQW